MNPTDKARIKREALRGDHGRMSQVIAKIELEVEYHKQSHGGNNPEIVLMSEDLIEDIYHIRAMLMHEGQKPSSEFDTIYGIPAKGVSFLKYGEFILGVKYEAQER